MKQLPVLFVSTLILACGGGEKPAASDAVEESTPNPVDQKAEALHDAMDKAHDVEGQLEDQKAAIDAALEEAEGNGPDG